MRRLAAVSGLLASLTAVLAGCAFLSGDVHGQSINDAIRDQLESQEPGPVGEVDISQIREGDWAHALIVCRGSSNDLVDQTLGFPWDGPRVDDVNFLSMIIFYDSSHVIDWFSAGQDDAVVDHWYFTLCPEPEDPDYVDKPGTIVTLEPEQSLEFTYSARDGFPHWYISSAQLASLQPGS